MGEVELFNIVQAAKYLQLKPETVKYHIYISGYLKPLRPTKRGVVFTQEMLDEFKRTVPEPGRKKEKKARKKKATGGETT